MNYEGSKTKICHFIIGCFEQKKKPAGNAGSSQCDARGL